MGLAETLDITAIPWIIQSMIVDQNVSTERLTAAERLVELIGVRIISGELPPGSKLSEADLSNEFGVSRAPLREALLRLEERRLIVRVPYSGTRVASLTKEALADLYEVREVLEGLACRRAAQLITSEEIDELRSSVEDGERRIRAMGDGDARQLPALRGFHQRIVEIGGNEELRRLLDRELWQFSRAMHRRWTRSTERLQIAVREHARILEALEARDPELAELLMRRHIVAARRGLQEPD